jgi:hypothetical protein
MEDRNSIFHLRSAEGHFDRYPDMQWDPSANSGNLSTPSARAKKRLIPVCTENQIRQYRPGIRRFEIYNVVQRHFAVVQFVAPDDDGLEGERAFAQTGDHCLKAGLDALGDGDLALAREQPNRAHLAQIHAQRVVGALDPAPWVWI